MGDLEMAHPSKHYGLGMQRHRFSIAAMMVAVIILALGLAALQAGTSFWLKAVYTATLVVLLLAIIGARYRPRGEAAFWFGFAVFGWGYFLMGIGPWTEWSATTVSGR